MQQYYRNVPYKNTGVAPKIPKTTLITAKTRAGNDLDPRAMEFWQWSIFNSRGDIIEFTIVDPSFPVVPAFELPWFEKGEHPPIGTLCEMTWERKLNWYPCVLLPDGYIASKKLPYAEWVVNKIVEFGDLEFRPIKTEKEKVIEAISDAMEENAPTPQVLNELWELGALQMPNKEPK